jgi:hypothetical protein
MRSAGAAAATDSVDAALGDGQGAQVDAAQ